MKIRIFTDGACSGNPGPGGWGAVILLKNSSQEISGFEKATTNNRMEIKAVVEGIKLTLGLGYENIEVHSDSAYVVNAIKKEWLKRWATNGWKTKELTDVKNKDLWVELYSILKKHKSINIVKVQGHSGDPNNEKADKLAVNAIQMLRSQQ